MRSGSEKPQVTRHAIKQFHERVRPDLTFEEAGRELRRFADTEELVDRLPWRSAHGNRGVMGWLPCGLGAMGLVARHHTHGKPMVMTCVTSPFFKVRHG